MTISTLSGSFTDDVTPAGGVPVIGPPECSTINSLLSDFTIDYCVNPADLDASGNLTFIARYGPAGTIAHIGNDISDGESGTTVIQVHVNPLPTCTIAPASSTVCQGAQATFTASQTGTGPFTYCWKKGCPGAGACVSTASTLNFASAQPADAGCYELTVTDGFGCTTTCQATLIVNPTPSCTIEGPSPVCPGTTHTYTSTVLPAGGTVTHSWTISGDGTINGPTDQASVSVTAGSVGGTFTVTDHVTRNGCPGECHLDVTVSPPPTCNITGPSPVCSGTENTYSSSVSPGGGTVTHSWTITGCGTINGSTTGSSVSVTAGPTSGGVPCTFTLTDNVTRDGCPGQCTLTVTVNPCAPRIQVVKLVACAQPGLTCATQPAGSYGKVANGVRGADDPDCPNDQGCPAFCYKVTVSATGSDVNLVDVTLTDDNGTPGNTSDDIITPIGNLAINGSATVYYSSTRCSDTHNIVVAQGQSALDSTTSGTVRATDSADVTVVPISVNCVTVLSASFDMDNNPSDNHITFPAGTVDAVVMVTVTISSGSTTIPLDVDVSGLPPLVDCDTGAAISTTGIRVLPGVPYVLKGCITVSCPGATYPISVVGTAVATTAVPCINNVCGHAIKTAPSACPASITCETPVTCRVTGGGTLIPGFVDESCITVNTTIFPFTSPNGLTINKITHGGQLGAPFSHMDCGEVLGNPCIRGQWQHTRHYEGTANPRDVIDMDFHSQTPKGQYDSLDCACLGCCDPETGVFITPIIVNGLCNPDDHKVCGPQPRPAPANAIIFSGIGRVTPTDDVKGSRAAQAEWVIFRVYIEDRSEPGGGHPGGAVEPADIYCFQAWKTGIKVSKKPDFTTISAAFRSALGAANCAFLDDLKSGALPIGSLPPPTVSGLTADIQDCGPLHDGNQQIHPSTSATCTQ